MNYLGKLYVASDEVDSYITCWKPVKHEDYIGMTVRFPINAGDVFIPIEQYDDTGQTKVICQHGICFFWTNQLEMYFEQQQQ